MIRCKVCDMNVDLEMEKCPSCTSTLAEQREEPKGEGLRFKATIRTIVSEHEVIVRWDHDALPSIKELQEKLDGDGVWVEPGELLGIGTHKVESIRIGHLLTGTCTQCGDRLVEMCPKCSGNTGG